MQLQRGERQVFSDARNSAAARPRIFGAGCERNRATRGDYRSGGGRKTLAGGRCGGQECAPRVRKQRGPGDRGAGRRHRGQRAGRRECETLAAAHLRAVRAGLPIGHADPHSDGGAGERVGSAFAADRTQRDSRGGSESSDPRYENHARAPGREHRSVGGPHRRADFHDLRRRRAVARGDRALRRARLQRGDAHA